MRPELDHIVESWLAETASTIADPTHVYPLVSARIHEQTQHRGRRLPRPSFGRTHSMISATRVVLAGAIVALFGGLLLVGILPQTGQVEAPIVGASPSTSPRKVEASPLSLETRQVAPGIERVTADGNGHDLGGVTTIAVGDTGAVWVATSTGSGGPEQVVFQLGQPPEDDRQGFELVGLEVADDGTLWAADDHSAGCGPGNEGPGCDQLFSDVMSFDGKTWERPRRDALDAGSGPDRSAGPDEIGGFAIHPDGTAWATSRRGANEFAVERLGPDGWTTYTFEDSIPRLPCDGDCGDNGYVVITPDGTVWTTAVGVGLLRFDGSDWEAVRPLGGDQDLDILSLAANRDGTLWAEVRMANAIEDGPSRLGVERRLARFDGERWDVFLATPTPDLVYAADSSYSGPGEIRAVGADGRVWLTDTYPDPETRGGSFPVSFDGDGWRRFPEVLEDWASDPVFELGECCMGPWHIATGPDGTAWANVDATYGHRSHGGVYVIRPEAAGSAGDDLASEPTPGSASPNAAETSVTLRPVMLPAEIPDGIDWGILDTPLGTARWVHLVGDRAMLPPLKNPVVGPSTGYIDFDGWRGRPQLWRSPDLITWVPEPLSIEAARHRLTLSGGTYWLYGSESASLWRSDDTRVWTEVDLDGLTPPGYDGYAWQVEVGSPVAFNGAAIVPLIFVTDHDTTLLGLPRIGSGLRFTALATNVYSVDNDEGHKATIRFEDIGSGLRVVDVEDGDAELAVLDGISMRFIERWAEREPVIELRAHAILDGAGVASLGVPGPLEQGRATEFFVDASGFVAVDLADGQIGLRRSTDGRDWIETDIVGDDPGEPAGLGGVENLAPWLALGGDHWISIDGVTWRSRSAMGDAIPSASGWLRWTSRDPDSVRYQPEGSIPVVFDISDMAITAPIDCCGTSLHAISSNTVVWTHELDGEGRAKEVWILTFDELPA